jgi:Protein of unknown function (DUF1592)/Protein of unknown function (DUF1588)/Protein of unknown function (DUF1595)/Protein of unknown function (DUF1585)/Protein of unknown function (DUF1587)
MMRRKQQHAPLSLLSVVFPIVVLASACAGRAGDASGSAGSPGSGGSGATGSGGSGATGSGGSGATGSGGSGATGSGGSGATVMQPPSVGLTLFTDTSLCQPGVNVGSTPLRRLSRIEYNNMIRDLGLDPNNTQPANQFVSEQKIDGNFNTNSYASISGTIFNQQYLEAAETLAAAAVASNLSSLVTCTTQDAACATQFINDFGGRAFRGQMDATESAALLTLYNNVRAVPFDFPTGIQAVITSILTSPRFLFVLEFGQPPASGTASAIPLTPLELATRLSLYLWRSLPDQTLTTAATGGHLATASDVATQATRMLADPKAAAALHDFADQWLDIENMVAVTKDTVFTTWSAALAQEMHMETLVTFSSTVLAATKNGLGDLLTSGSSYVNKDLTTFYNTPASYVLNTAGPGVAADYKSTAVGSASAPRMGILTDGSVLAIHAHTTLPSPTKRGRMVRQQILCEQVPNPPAAVGGVPIPPPPTMIPAGQTTRSQYLTHVSTNGVCNGCHEYMDWIGFGFDNYDATGAYITAENGTMVVSSGMFIAHPASTDITGNFTGTTDMISKLVASPQVDQCYALEQIRYALGRVESNSDACSAQQIYKTFSTNNSFNLQQLLVAVVSSDSFMNRPPVNAGGACQ